MIRASAPGSLMVLGEHAVLDNRPALVVSHEARLVIQLEAAESGFSATSDLWGGSIDLSASLSEPAASFVHIAFQEASSWGSLRPFKLHISSNCPSQRGWGSSAAVVVATLGALWSWHTQKLCMAEHERMDLWRAACGVIRHVQSLGSGADAAASLWGGVVLVDLPHNKIEKIAPTLPLVAVYCGFKEKTTTVVPQVKKRLALFSHVGNALFEVSDCLVRQAIPAIRAADWKSVGILMDIAQGLMESYGVNLPVLQDLVFRLRQHPHCRGAKISGSGLGDCVIGLFENSKACEDVLIPGIASDVLFPLQVTEKGLVLESL